MSPSGLSLWFLKSFVPSAITGERMALRVDLGRALGVLGLSLLLLACSSPSGAAGDGSQRTGAGGRGSAPRILTLSISEDPRNFWDGVNGGGGSGTRELGHLVNQYLAAVLPDGTAEPRLLARLPSIENG